MSRIVPTVTAWTAFVWILCAATPALASPPAQEHERLTAAEAAERAADEETHHGDAHGHQVQHIDNWFSLSVGPDKEHKNAPLFWSIFNFVVMVWLLVRFGGKPFKEYLHNRRATISRDLEEAAALNLAARTRLEEIEKKMARLDQEIAEIKESVAKDAELEKQRIIENAHTEADRIIAQADKTLDKELRRAHRQLEIEAISAAMEAAEKVIRQRLNDADHKRLNDEYFAQLGESAGGTN